MAFRSWETIQAWVDEYTAAQPSSPRAKVVPQDGMDGADTGLVVVSLRNATTSIYVAPLADDDTQWRVDIEPQPEVTELSPEALHDLARELADVADLCAYLQEKSIARGDAD